jgi:chitinase
MNGMNIIKQFPLSFKSLIFLCLSNLFFFNHVYSSDIVVGYYAAWLRSTLPAENILFENLTHINHAFAWPDQNGQIVMSDNLLYPQLNNLAHQNNVKVSISLGGWGNSEGFSPMVADSTLRSEFIDNMVNFLNTNNYDGIDLDWEFPNTISDRNNLTILVKELRDRFNSENPEWLITMAVGTSDWKGQWYDYSQLIQYVDWFNAMCYDFHGSWSSHAGHNAPLYQPTGEYDGAVDIGMDYLHNTRQIPKNQLTVGMPFYGKQFNATRLYGSFTGDVTDYYFSHIMPKLNNDWTYYWDDVSKVPYLQNDLNSALITFEDTISVRYKCEWIQDQGFYGGMIWALGQDLYDNKQILLGTIGRYLLNTSTTTRAASVEIPTDFQLENNFPNPFNPQTKIKFKLNKANKVSLNIYNVNGQKVKTLINQFMKAGSHNVTWDGQDDNGIELASDIYFYRIIIGDFISVKKMLMIK